MQKPRINAHIQEVGSAGAYYPVRLTWTPRAGELIELTSFIDRATGSPAMHWYEVVQLVHELHDVHDGEERTYGDDHFVRILVKRVSNDVVREAALSNENVAEDDSQLAVGTALDEDAIGTLLDDGDDRLLN